MYPGGVVVAPEARLILSDLQLAIAHCLGSRLVGLYLYGSLVTGDYEEDVSDLDLLAVLASDLTDAEFDALERIHTEVAERFPHWADRVEVAYLAQSALQTFRVRRSPLTVISPGEPLNTKDAGADWLINWYTIRNQGVALFGPPPSSVIAEVTRDEFTHAVRVQTEDWREWVDAMTTRPAQAYAILTLCRALYAVHHGENASKHRAAEWAAGVMPEWADLIAAALRWRREHRSPVEDPSATREEMKRFVWTAADRLAGL
jgi:hypothetical protein